MRVLLALLLVLFAACRVDVAFECTRAGDLCGPSMRCLAVAGNLQCVAVAEDAGLRRDGGAAADGGGVADGGNALDGGTPADGGADLDGGAPDDGGPSTDGGVVIPDGGIVIDDGGIVIADGGVPIQDGGIVPVDGGAPDAGVPPADGGNVMDGGIPPDGGPVTLTPCQAASVAMAAATVPVCPPLDVAALFAALCPECSAGGTFPCNFTEGDLVVDTTLSLQPGCHIYNNVTVNASGVINVSSLETRPTVLKALNNMSVAGRIMATGQGYSANTGPGQGTGQSGGGHGGTGGDAPVAFGGDTYDDPCLPVQAGSGGATIDTITPRASAGGGAVAVLADGTVVLDGHVEADANAGSTAGGGGGAGGSVIIGVVGTLSGTGKVLARGGGTNAVASGGGGGGMIRFVGDWTMFTGVIDARGGARASNAPGRAGTFYADVWPNDWAVRGGFALLPQAYKFSDLALVDGDAEIFLRPDLSDRTDPLRPLIRADTVQVAAGNAISADREGFRGGMGPGAGVGDLGGGGGGYGGAGGDGSNGKGGPAYGKADEPADVGSGGAGLHGGAGGGLVLLCAEQGLFLNGVLSADGESRRALTGSAGGSGGSVFVQAATFQGTGTFRARGAMPGPTVTDAGGGGGGGRIRVIIGDATTVTGRCDASGGGNGSAGTALCP
jgi:hypothetical protein